MIAVGIFTRLIILEDDDSHHARNQSSFNLGWGNLMLARQWLGPSTNSPHLVLAHGFTQNARCWGTFGDICSETFDVIAVDGPGHGWSGQDDVDLSQAGRLIVEAGGPAHYVGYSMGGRMLLHAALNSRTGDIRSLILIGVTPGIELATERSERWAQDARLATRITEIGTPAFVNEWLAQPMFAHLTDEQSAKVKRYENSAEGMAGSLSNCGTGSQESLWDRLSTLPMPVLVIAGTNDEKYTAIGERMVEAIGSNARFVNIEGGHAVHLENPAVTAAVVASWGTQLSG